MTDYSKLSDDELRQMLVEDPTPAADAQALKRERTRNPPLEPVDNSMGMSGPQLAAAGFAKSFLDPLYYGPQELLQTMFRTGPGDLEELNRKKADRKKADDMLMSNWPAKAGNVAGQAAALATGPSRMGAQVGLSGLYSALSPSEGPIESTSGLLATRGMQGLEGSASALIPGMAIGALGHVGGALKGKYIPGGDEALRLDAAGKRLGVPRNLGGLDPSSGLNAFETNIPGYARTVEDQVKAYTEAAKKTVSIPSKSGKSSEARVLPGEQLREALVNSGEKLKAEGTDHWKTLDDFVMQNNLSPVSASASRTPITEIIQNYTPTIRKQPRLDKNPILARISEYDPEAIPLLVSMMTPGKKAPEIPFGDVHKLQTAVGRALGRAEKDASVPGSSMEDRQAKNQLKRLYSTLMSDVDSWGTTNPQAKDLYKVAKDFWREKVVPGALNNRVLSKADRGTYGSNPRAYQEPSQFYHDVVNNPRAMGDLRPYMDPRGKDLLDTLNTMPDMANSLITNTPHPPAPGMGTITTIAGMLAGSPLQLMKGAISHAPGFRDMMVSTPAKRLYFSRDLTQDTPLGKAAWALGRIPQQEIEEKVRGVRAGIKN